VNDPSQEARIPSNQERELEEKEHQIRPFNHVGQFIIRS